MCSNDTIKFRVFLDVALCSHTEVYRRFRGAYCLHHQGDGWWWWQYAPLKHLSTSTWLHGAISQKTLNFILADVRTWNLTNDTICFKPHDLFVRDKVRVICSYLFLMFCYITAYSFLIVIQSNLYLSFCFFFFTYLISVVLFSSHCNIIH
jgi:hypothetical protein